MAVALAKNHSPAVVALFRRAYYAGAIAVDAILERAATLDEPGALAKVTMELAAYVRDMNKGEFS